MEMSPIIPVSILRHSRVVINEAAPGLRASILELMSSIPDSILNSGPAEKSRVLFLLCWFHSVLVQRLHFVPVAFSKSYDFNDADFKAALYRIDSWMTRTAKGKANLDPSSTPWAAIQFILRDYAMGGRIDGSQDLLVLESLMKRLFDARAFDVGYTLASLDSNSEESLKDVKLQDERSWDSFKAFARLNLPEVEDPRILGLPENSLKVMAVAEAEKLVSSLRKMRSVDQVESAETAGSTTGVVSTKWMLDLSNWCQQLQKDLPEVSRLFLRRGFSLCL